MRFDIRYRTLFDYGDVVRDSQNEVRVCPTSDDHQQLLAYRISTRPAARFLSFTDYFATRVDAYGIREPHVALELEAEATVETRPRPLVPVSPRLDSLRDPAFVEEHVEYLERTRHTDWGAGVNELSEAILDRSDPDVVSLVLTVHRRVHHALQYHTGHTAVGDDVEAVLAGGVGVCQDYAHLAVALCRPLGVPARYVSGYLFAVDDRSGTIGDEDVVEVSTHAWFEAAIPGFGWIALDPTNAVQVGERHVTIGRGRDYDDVPPLRGAYFGAAGATTQSSVEMRRLADQPRPHHQQQHQQQQQQQ